MEMNDMTARDSVNNYATNSDTPDSKILTNVDTGKDLSMENNHLLPSQADTANEVKTIIILHICFVNFRHVNTKS